MLASVYIKDGNIHLHNEGDSHSNLGGIKYELGRPLLDFICYNPNLFNESFSEIVEVFNHDLAYESVKEPTFKEGISEIMGELQQQEAYIFFYGQMFMEFIYDYVESPRKAIEQLAEKLPNAKEDILTRLDMYMNFIYPGSGSNLVEVAFWRDSSTNLYKAAKAVVEIVGDDLRKVLEATIHEIEWLIHTRNIIGPQRNSSLDYLFIMEEARRENEGHYFFLEQSFRTFYGITEEGIAQLYEIHSLTDLFRFEFVKMIEHDVFIKKCKNCGHFFIPRRRSDAEYCHRISSYTGKACNEVGAMIQYEKRVAENPILEAHKKAYRRFNSRTRTGKMSQADFLTWSEEASRKRDECVAGELSFEEFMDWLEQGRVRKSRNNESKTENS